MSAIQKAGAAALLVFASCTLLYHMTLNGRSNSKTVLIPTLINREMQTVRERNVILLHQNSSISLDEIALKILNATERIAKSSKLCSDRESVTTLEGVYMEFTNLLHQLGYKYEIKHLSQSLTAAAHQNPANPDVCQENYEFKNILKSDPKYIFYRRIGFYLENCTDVPEFHTLITLVFNFVKYDSKYHKYIPDMFHDVNRLYPGVRVVAAVPEDLSLKDADTKDVTIVKIKSETESDIWNKLISRVTTKYIYIGRNVIKMMWHVRLERLVREINNLEASVVSGAFRTLTSGEWTNGCFQSGISNYMLMYKHGYHRSKEECLFCHHVNGPFVAKTEFMKQNRLPPKSSATSSFALWFLKLKKLDKNVVSCPDSMSFVTDESQINTTKQDWLELAQSLQVEVISLNAGTVFEFNCDEAKTFCTGKTRSKGFIVSRCCMKKLFDAISYVMKMCREGHMMCQLNAGTSLGAVKFNNILPWEPIDADILIHPDNITNFAKLCPTVVKRGYSWDIQGKGYFTIHSPHWMVEVFTDVIRTPAADGITPTMIEFNGNSLETTINPGLFGRNTYGSEIYQHAQHWRHTGTNKKESIWIHFNNAAKKFSKCSKPGHHSCLDQFNPDGNLMLEEPTV